MPHVVSVNKSDNKGEVKTPVPSISLAPDLGVEGDAHSGPWHRQVSLLAEESIERALEAARSRAILSCTETGFEPSPTSASSPISEPALSPGAFAENITTRGLDLAGLPVGTRLAVGEARLEVTQIGKECHGRCAIYYQIGDCVMPREGIFARVTLGGVVRPGDSVNVIEGDD